MSKITELSLHLGKFDDVEFSFTQFDEGIFFYESVIEDSKVVITLTPSYPQKFSIKAKQTLKEILDTEEYDISIYPIES